MDTKIPQKAALLFIQPEATLRHDKKAIFHFLLRARIQLADAFLHRNHHFCLLSARLAGCIYFIIM